MSGGLHVVLVEPRIHWNTGNAGRSCVAAGAQLHLVEPLGFSLDERYVRRAGVHQWQHVNPRIWPSWAAFEAELASLGQPFLFTTHGARDLATVTIPEQAALIFGNEESGLAAALRERYPSALVRIPLVNLPGISLNLSTAVGIGLYEAIRQRQAPTDPRVGFSDD